jgi:hypothetical protein
MTLDTKVCRDKYSGMLSWLTWENVKFRASVTALETASEIVLDRASRSAAIFKYEALSLVHMYIYACDVPATMPVVALKRKLCEHLFADDTVAGIPQAYVNQALYSW